MPERKVLVFGPDRVQAESIARHLAALEFACEIRALGEVSAADGEAVKVVPLAILKPSEVEALQARADEESNCKAARKVDAHLRTYEDRLRAAREKLGCDSTACAVVRALRLGLIR